MIASSGLVRNPHLQIGFGGALLVCLLLCRYMLLGYTVAVLTTNALLITPCHLTYRL